MISKKLLIDSDPGIGDALAVTLALFAPDLDVLALTAVEGVVSAQQANRNVMAIVEQLDPPRSPRTGMARGGSVAPSVHARLLHGDDGLGNNEFAVARLHQEHPAEKILADLIREEPATLTILTLGPLTNLAHTLTADPELGEQIGRVVMLAGSVSVGGDVSAAAEANIAFDPVAADVLFRSQLTKTLVPRDLTLQWTQGLEVLDWLPSADTRAGRFLARTLPYLYRAARQHDGLEVISLPEIVALLVAMYPQDFDTLEMAGAVEVEGTLCRGATVFDRRPRPEWRANMEVAVGMNVHQVRDRFRALLDTAGRRSAD